MWYLSCFFLLAQLVELIRVSHKRDVCTRSHFVEKKRFSHLNSNQDLSRFRNEKLPAGQQIASGIGAKYWLSNIRMICDVYDVNQISTYISTVVFK